MKVLSFKGISKILDALYIQHTLNSFNIILAASVDYMHAMKTITLTNAGVWRLYDKLQKWIDKKHIKGKKTGRNNGTTNYTNGTTKRDDVCYKQRLCKIITTGVIRMCF